ncbi:MAG: CRTAC1 family protein [Myxococcota bacterium]|jgi:hypothetical protein|nr:CRTAC1 family protein [Myxococcota bacterium]
MSIPIHAVPTARGIPVLGLGILALSLGCKKDAEPDYGACEPREVVTPDSGFFTDISDASGIRVDNYYEDAPDGTSINDHSRLAFADLDGDGFDDIVMHSLFPNALNGVPFEHLVFLNNQDGTFTDFSDASGLRDVQAGFLAFGDVDNDGDQDAFAGLDLYDFESYTNEILLNDGSGVFTVLDDSEVDDSSFTAAANAVFADFDGDAFLDLYVGNGGTMYALYDFFYLGNGDGTFTYKTRRLDDGTSQPSNGSTTCDYDDDGDPDVFVSTYSVSTENGLNTLWENEAGSFTDVAVDRGFASLATGNYWLSSTDNGTSDEPDVEEGSWIGSNGFGLDCGDVDNDGDLDIFLTAISHPTSSDYGRKWSDPSQLLINQGEAEGYRFVNEFLERGLPFNEGDVDGALVDFDNDGRFDLSLSRDTKYEGSYDEDDQLSWFGLMWQEEDGSFQSLGVSSGINDPDLDLERMKGAQNHAWSDIDHDGDLDLLVGGRDQGGGRPNFLFRNEIGADNRWLAVQLDGDGSHVNRDAIGTRVQMVWQDETIAREKKSSRGMYNSEDTRTLHFGLGDRSCEYQLEVLWPDGTTASFAPADLPEEGYVRITYPDQLEAL